MTTTPPTTPIPTMMHPAAALAALRDDGAVVDSAADPKSKENYTFNIDRTFADGKQWVGAFTNRILSPEEKVSVSLLITKMSKGAAWDTLDEDGKYLLSMIAHLTLSLTDKPAWFDVTKIKHMPLLTAVYQEVTAHEEFFRRPYTPPARSQG